MSKDVEEKAIWWLRGLAKDTDPNVRVAAASGLSQYIHNAIAVWVLRGLAKDEDPRVRQAAALALDG